VSIPVTTPGAIAYPYFGDVEHSTATTPTRLEAPYLTILRRPSGTMTIEDRILALTDGNWKVSPPKWIPEEKAYSFTSLTGKLIEKVTGWRPYWEIELQFGGRDIRREMLNAIRLMSSTVFTFGTTGATADRSFLFYPAGDFGRAGIPVVLPADEIAAELLGGRLIGYTGSKFVIMGANLYDDMAFPEIDSGVTHERSSYGSFLTDDCHVWVDPSIVIPL